MIYIVVALPAEAKPLRRWFDLKASHHHAFPLFQADNLRLIVSGAGKMQAAAACAYLHCQEQGEPGRPAAWINVGVAGHGNWDVGTVFEAHKITDSAGAQHWYPFFSAAPAVPTTDLVTVDQPKYHYTDQDAHTAFDMEAAGVAVAVSRFSTMELFRTVKVVSDNRRDGAGHINAARVEELMGLTETAVKEEIQHLEPLTNVGGDHPLYRQTYEQCLSHWRFSESQRNQLKRLLRRWFALEADSPWPACRSCSDARSVLQTLQTSTRRGGPLPP